MEKQKNKTNWVNGLIGLSIIALIIWMLNYMKQCSEDWKKQSSEVTATDSIVKYMYQTNWDTIKGKDIITPGETVYIPVPAIVDTNAILKDYFAKNIYKDTLQDSNIIAIRHFTISENKLQQNYFTYKLLKPNIETTITRTVTAKKKSSFFLGFNAGTGNKFAFGPEALFVTKNQKAFGIGYDAINKNINGKFLIKL